MLFCVHGKPRKTCELEYGIGGIIGKRTVNHWESGVGAVLDKSGYLSYAFTQVWANQEDT